MLATAAGAALAFITLGNTTQLEGEASAVIVADAGIFASNFVKVNEPLWKNSEFIAVILKTFNELLPIVICLVVSNKICDEGFFK